MYIIRSEEFTPGSRIGDVGGSAGVEMAREEKNVEASARVKRWADMAVWRSVNCKVFSFRQD